MTRLLSRLVLVLLLTLGILLPRTSAALVQLGLIEAQIIVICSGDGLQTILLDRDGSPVEAHESSTHDCLLAHAVDTATPVGAARPAGVSAASLPPAYAQVLLTRPQDDAPARAPPVV